MLEWLKSIWAGSPPVEFESAFDLAQSVERLRAATKRSAFLSMAHQAAVGTVKQSRVSLYRTIPMMHNSFKPIFIGRFEDSGGKVVLRGRFAIHWFVKLLMAVWFGILGLGVIAALVAGIGPDEISGIAAMIAGGLGLVGFCRWLSRKDSAWLSGVIASALTDTGPVGLPSPGFPIHIPVFAGLLAAEGVADLVLALNEVPPRYLSGLIGGVILACAFGVYRRHRLAWWAGFAIFAYWGFGFFDAAANPSLPIPEEVAQFGPGSTASTILGLLVLGLGGWWWYAQRVHFKE